MVLRAFVLPLIVSPLSIHHTWLKRSPRWSTLYVPGSFPETTSFQLYTRPSRASLWATSSEADPFRPQKHPVDPVIINLVLHTTVEGHDLDVALEDFRARRVVGGCKVEDGKDEDLLSLDEWTIVEERTRGVAKQQLILQQALEAAVDANPWIAKFKATGDYGLLAEEGAKAVKNKMNPLVALCRAECLLALWMLHMAPNAPLSVPFIDDEKKDVLSHVDAIAALILSTPEQEGEDAAMNAT